MAKTKQKRIFSTREKALVFHRKLIAHIYRYERCLSRRIFSGSSLTTKRFIKISQFQKEAKFLSKTFRSSGNTVKFNHLAQIFLLKWKILDKGFRL